MPSPVEISVRLTPDGYVNLQRLCQEHGISVRAAVEAGALCFLHVVEKKILTPAEAELEAAVFEAAGRADGAPRSEKVNVRIEPEILVRLRLLVEPRRVSVSAVLAMTFMPWGTLSPEAYETRAEVWRCAVRTAQRMDFERRMKRPVTLRCDVG